MKYFLYIFIFLFGFSSSVFADSLYYLALKSQVAKDFDHLSLADVTDSSKTSPELLSRYGAIQVSPADKMIGLQPSDVLLALSLAGADLSEIQLVNSGDVAIQTSRDSEVVEEIKRAVRTKLVQVKGDGVKDVPLEFYSMPNNLPDRKSFVRAEAELVNPENDGYHMIVHFLSTSGATISVADVGVKFSIKKKVVVANRFLSPGEFVSASDFSEVDKTVSDESTAYFHSLSELGDKRWLVSETIEQGAGLKKSSINFAINFQKGSVVTLVAGNGNFKIRTKGRVKEVLDNGASVLVENVDSKKEILGRPLGPGEVKIDY